MPTYQLKYKSFYVILHFYEIQKNINKNTNQHVNHADCRFSGGCHQKCILPKLYLLKSYTKNEVVFIIDNYALTKDVL